MLRTRSFSDLVTPVRVIGVTFVVLALLLLACRPAPAQGLALSFGGRNWAITVFIPPPSGGPGWYGNPYAYQPPCSEPYRGYNPGYGNVPYGQNYGYGERGSYSRDWNDRGQWSEQESYRSPSGSFRRTTTCDPRRGCETEVTRTERFVGPYTSPW